MKLNLNYKKIKDTVYREGKEYMRTAVKNAIIQAEDEARQKLLSNFDSHLITEEIKLGPQAPNISGTLNGYGNLFSFLGFYESDDPIAELRAYFAMKTNIQVKGTIRKGVFNVIIEGPNMKEIEGFTKLPWANFSWAKAVEGDISGFESYLFTDYIPQSRSGGAVQVESRIRNSKFARMDYLTPIIQDYYSSIKKYL